jgi:DNA-binding transcriptional regulator YiaG
LGEAINLSEENTKSISYLFSNHLERMTTQELGIRLQTRRQKLQLSQAYVAELAGLSTRQLLNWEAGRSNPGFAQLQAVLAVLGLDLDIELKLLP